MPKLAIVIPAYKPDFFSRTLQSLADQTCKDFSVYVGDDASPFDLASIVEKYRDHLNVNYFRFANNLGKKNLSDHWKRCVELCNDEDWVCLFSDDDVIESGCIEAFHHTRIPDSVDVLHFDINLIDANEHVVQNCPPYPQRITSSEFFDKLFRRQLVARMPEFIFRKSFLERIGFISFDLAWRSDTATVLAAGKRGGIVTIKGSKSRVLWRISDSNISGGKYLEERKNRASLDFFNWSKSFFESNGFELPMGRLYLLKTIVFSLEYRKWDQFLKDVLFAASNLDYARGIGKLWLLSFAFYRLIYRKFE